jgi:hypothetical protein
MSSGFSINCTDGFFTSFLLLQCLMLPASRAAVFSAVTLYGLDHIVNVQNYPILDIVGHFSRVHWHWFIIRQRWVCLKTVMSEWMKNEEQSIPTSFPGFYLLKNPCLPDQHEVHLWIYYMSKLLNTSEFINMITSRHLTP